MPKDRINVVEDRLLLLERRLELLDYRVRSVEAWRAGTGIGAPAPVEPVRAAVAAPPPVIVPPQVVTAPQAVTPPRPPKEDAEYMIGAKVLPKIGAGVVLLAVVYFVQLGYTNGWITPWMIFWAATLFCLGFIGVGQWKRNEREQYGQILTGIGSCGLYITLAAGHLAQNLFSGEVLVTAFMGLSLANLGYGLWSRSRSFLAIGILGGFIAAMMPIDKDKFALDAVLHLAIVIPAAWIAAKRKWADMGAWLWILSTAALVPLLLSPADWRLKIGTLFAASLIAMAAYVWSYESNDFDPQALLAPVLLFVTALIGFAVQNTVLFVWPLLAFGAGVALLARLGKPERSLALIASGVAIPATLAPFCFPPAECVAIFVGLSLGAAALAFVHLRTAQYFAMLEFVLAGSKYVATQVATGFPPHSEAWLLVGLMAAAIVSACVAVRAGGGAEPFTLGAMAIVLPIVARLGIVTLAHTSVAPTMALSLAETILAFALASVAVAAVTRWSSAVAAMWFAFGLAVFTYIAAALEAPAVAYDASLVTGLILTALVGLPVAIGTSAVDMRKSISGVAGVVVGLLVMRLTYVLAPSIAVSPVLALGLIAALYSMGASVAAAFRRSEAAATVAWAMFVAAGVVYVNAVLSGLPLAQDGALSTSLLAAFVAGCVAIAPSAARWRELWHVVAIVGWVVVSRWVDVAFTWAGADLRNVSTATVAWILYALALLGVGFWLKVQELRYWSFAVMFATTVKILAIDLSSTPIPVRVAVLLGLGLLMLGGGYWYIKGRHTGATA